MSQSRSDISKENTWNLNSFFSTKGDWEKELDQLLSVAKEGWKSLSEYKGKLSCGDPATIKKLLEKYFEYSRSIEKIYTFSHLKHDENIADDENKAGYDKSIALYHMFSNGSSWVEPELLKIDEETLMKLMEHKDLDEYKFYLMSLCDQKEHILTDDKEEILALARRAQETPRGAFSALSNVDLDFGEVEDSEGKRFPLTHG